MPAHVASYSNGSSRDVLARKWNERKAVLRTGLGYYSCDFRDDRFEIRNRFYLENDDTLLYPFEFRIFGLGYYGDVKSHRKFDEVFSGIRSGTGRLVERQRSGLEVWIAYGTKLLVDPKTDDGPLEHFSGHSKYEKSEDTDEPKLISTSVVSRCKLSLTEVSGISVPCNVVYQADLNPNLIFDLKWLKLNEDLGPEVFDPAVLGANSLVYMSAKE